MDTEKSQASVLLQHMCEAFPDPVFIFDEEGMYVEIAGAAERELYDSAGYLREKKLHDIFSDAEAERFLATVKRALDGNSLQIIEYELTSADMNYNPMDGPTSPQWYQGRVYPVRLPGETIRHVIWIAINITDRKRAEIERDQATADLKQALSEIKTLRGILPICANCKKIRDDRGFWRQIEAYIDEHSEAELSHSICPECTKALYPDLKITD